MIPAIFGKNSGASNTRTRGSTDDEWRDDEERSWMNAVSAGDVDVLREDRGAEEDDASRRIAATMLRALKATK